MIDFLDPDWFAALVERASSTEATPGASAVLDVTVEKGPRGPVRARIVVDEGRVVSAQVDPSDGAECQLTCPYDLAVELATGETEPAVAFMQGRLKVNGDMGALHRVLPLTAEPAFAELIDELGAETDF